MSKFDYDNFHGEDAIFAVNAEKYTMEEAIKLFNFECNRDVGIEKGQSTVSKGWVRHRAGVNENDEPCVGWWIEDCIKTKGCEAWVFSLNYRKVEVKG